MDPLLTLVADRPAVLRARAWPCSGCCRASRSTPFNSLLVTFGLTVHRRGADPVRLDRRLPQARVALRRHEVRASARCTCRCRNCSRWCWRCCSRSASGRCCATPTSGKRAARAGGGRADRRRLRRQPARATRCCWPASARALAGVAGVCLALSLHAAPSQIYAWIGVVFAAVMLGGLGRALGPLVAGIVIGVSEAVTMAVTVAVVGAAGVVHAADRDPAAAARAAPEARPRRSSAILRRGPACWRACRSCTAAGVLRVVPLPRVPLDRAGHVVEHPVGLLGLLLVRARRVLRRRHVHDGDARRQARRAVPVDAAGRRGAGGRRCSASALGAVVFRVRARARRAVRAADAGGHVRARARSCSTRRSTAAPAST